MAELVTAETGPGDIAQYVNHPLNLTKSESVGQILRGLTGLASVFGVHSLRLALLDVAAGVFSAVKGAAGRVRPPGPEAGGFDVGA